KNLVDNPKAIILISHGLAEHCQRYDYITNKLNTLEYSVYRYDYRGHGLSDGKRGFFNDINDLVNDVSLFINLIKQENPNSPVFLLGYDIGGHILLEYGHQFKKQVNGIILCSPLVCDTLGLTKTKYTNVNDFTLIPINKSQDYTHNPTIQNKYENDPMVLKKIPLGTYKSLRKSCFGIIDNLYKFKYPTLILHSSSDNIISHEDSKFLFENILSLDKDIRILNGLYHNLLDEIVRDNIIEEICKWIEKRLS
ncbi:MAG: lysophospholipase, partial [Peptostreptococcaceae bacterium]